MKKFWVKTVALILVMSSAAPAEAQSRFNREGFKPFLTREKTQGHLSIGLRQNNFDWNIASDITGTATPNILSELTWEGITLLEVKGGIRHLQSADFSKVRGDLLLEAEGALGGTLSGDNRDSDYAGDNRTIEFLRSDNDAGEGYYVSGAVTAGYQFRLTGPDRHAAKEMLTTRRRSSYYASLRRQKALHKLTNPSRTIVNLTPLVGYEWEQQDYKIKDGVQTINLLNPGNEGDELPDLNVEYVSEWHGPFIGLEGEIKSGKSNLRLRGQYYDLTYYAEGFWRANLNFHPDPSFVHEADGQGYRLNAQYAYDFDSNYSLLLDAAYKQRTAEDGVNTQNLVTGAIAKSRLNEVNDESYALHMGVRYNW